MRDHELRTNEQDLSVDTYLRVCACQRCAPARVPSQREHRTQGPMCARPAAAARPLSDAPARRRAARSSRAPCARYASAAPSNDSTENSKEGAASPSILCGRAGAHQTAVASFAPRDASSLSPPPVPARRVPCSPMAPPRASDTFAGSRATIFVRPLRCREIAVLALQRQLVVPHCAHAPRRARAHARVATRERRTEPRE